VYHFFALFGFENKVFRMALHSGASPQPLDAGSSAMRSGLMDDRQSAHPDPQMLANHSAVDGTLTNVLLLFANLGGVIVCRVQ
jgi:hypothetical protein